MSHPLFLSNAFLFVVLIGIGLKDIKSEIIPDFLLIILAILGLMRYGMTHGISALVLGILAYALYKLYPLFKKKEGLGFGDVKLMAVSGMWLTLSQIPFFLILSGVMGIITALLWRRLKKTPRFPLGPALALALGICIIGNDGFSKRDTMMTTTFSGPTLLPASGGKPDSIVVLIHGYGSDGDDLISLGKSWASLLPHTLFVAPHAPMSSVQNPSGKQWFGLMDWEPTRIIKEMQALTPAFNRYLDDLLKTHHLPPEKLALVGFSQGAMLALHVGLHRLRCGGVVAYSGAFLEDPLEFKIARPSVLLVHGTEDQVLPASFSEMAEKRLKVLGVPVTLSLLPGLDHGIDGRALGLGGAFLKEHLYE